MINLVDVDRISMRKKTSHHKSRSFIEIRLFHDATPHTYSKISSFMSSSTNEIDLFVPETEKKPDELLKKWFDALNAALKNVKRYSDVDKYLWDTHFITNKKKKKILTKTQTKINLSETSPKPKDKVVIAKDKKCDKFHLDETKRNFILIASVLLSSVIIIQFSDTFHKQLVICLCTISFMMLLYVLRSVEDKSVEIIEEVEEEIMNLPRKLSIRPRKRSNVVIPRPGSSLPVVVPSNIDMIPSYSKIQSSEKKDPDDESKADDEEKEEEKIATSNPRPINSTFYRPTLGTDVRLRIGPDYAKNKQKARGDTCMYGCVATDLLHPNPGDDQLMNIGEIYRQEGALSYPKLMHFASSCRDDKEIVVRDVPLPRVIIVQLLLPDIKPSLWGGPKPDEMKSKSLVMHFHIKPDTIEDVMKGDKASPAVRLLSRFAKEARNKNSAFVRSHFKTVFKLPPKDFDKLGIGFATSYNGKPIMLRRTIAWHVSPPVTCGKNRFMYEYMEIDIHVTRWDYLQRRLAYGMIQAGTLKDIEVLIGFLVEGVSNDELPERLFGAVECAKIDWDVSMPFP